MIVDAFTESLEIGLGIPGQVVVGIIHLILSPRNIRNRLLTLSTQPMIPTFVFGWPSGHEVGEYLALDLGAFASCRYPRSGISQITRWDQPPCMSRDFERRRKV
jgi:hypothetical protein